MRTAKFKFLDPSQILSNEAMPVVTQHYWGRQPQKTDDSGMTAAIWWGEEREPPVHSTQGECCECSLRHNFTQQGTAVERGEPAVDQLSGATVIVMGVSCGGKASVTSWGERKWHCIKTSPLIAEEGLTFISCVKGISGPWRTFIQMSSWHFFFFKANINVAQRISVISVEQTLRDFINTIGQVCILQITSWEKLNAERNPNLIAWSVWQNAQCHLHS